MTETLIIESVVSEGVSSVETQTISVESPLQVFVTLTEQPDALVVESDTSGVSIVEDTHVHIVAEGSQGPQGIQGPTGPTGGTALQYPAGEALGGHRMVVLNDAGAAVYADHTNLTHANKVLGMTTGAASMGAIATIQTGGEHTEPSWSWTLNQPIYLNTTGLLTQVTPTTGFSLILGFPITTTSAFFAMREPIILN